MATFERHVDVDWQGGLMDGKGEAKAGTGAFTLPVTAELQPSHLGPGGRQSQAQFHRLGAVHAGKSKLGREFVRLVQNFRQLGKPAGALRGTDFSRNSAHTHLALISGPL